MPEECKVRGNTINCDTNQFLRAMGVEHLSIDKVNDMISDGCGEECSQRIYEEQYMECIQQCEDDSIKKHINNLESCAESFLTNHPIKGVEGVDFDRENNKVKIKMSDKKEFVNSIRETINGVGMFTFNSNKEFVETTGNSVNKTIETHLGWLKDAPEVWGTQSIKRCMERD